MKTKQEHLDYINGICKQKKIKDLKKIIKYLDQGDTLNAAREKMKTIRMKKKKEVIKYIDDYYMSFELNNAKVIIKDLEGVIMKTCNISRSTFYNYHKEYKLIRKD